MGFQPTPWEIAAYFFEDHRLGLITKLPDSVLLIRKEESTDRQDRLEVRAYEGFGGNN